MFDHKEIAIIIINIIFVASFIGVFFFTYASKVEEQVVKDKELPEHWQVHTPPVTDASLARFYALVLFHGGLTRDLRQFYITSSSKLVIRDFAGIVRAKFGLTVPYARKNGRRTFRCIVCSLKIGRWLNEQGFQPKRKASEIRIPAWIADDKNNLAAFEAARTA